MSEAQDDVGAQEMDQPTTESFTELEEVAEEQEMSPAGNKHDHIVDGEDMVVLDDASEAERTETLDIDHQISTTSEDVLGGIGGEGAELHPEYDDFDVDDQHFEVLETADGDFSGESHDLEQSPNLDDSLSEKKERERESGKRERSSYEKSGDKSRSKETESHSNHSRGKSGESSGRWRERSKEGKSGNESASSSASPSGSSSSKKDDKDKRPISPIVFGSQKDSRQDKDKDHEKSGSKSSRKSNSGPHRVVDKLFGNTRYFVIKSNNYENVQIAKDRNVWSTPPYNEKKLNKAYKDCRNVILIFSVRESGRFQGIARLVTEARHDGHHVPWVLPPGISQSQLGGVFKLDWLHKGSLEFSACMDLKNPWNDNKPVKISRDGQEVEPNVGEKLCRLWQKIETDDDVLSGRDQRGGASGGHSGGGNSSTSMPHSGHMTHFASRPGLPYPPVYPHYGYPPMGQMFASTHPGDARSRLTSQHMFHPPSKRHLNEADALLSKKRKVEDHSGSSSGRKSSRRRSGDGSSHSRSSRGEHHRSSGERVRERKVERTGHTEKRAHQSGYREEKRKGRKRSHSHSSDSSFEDDFGVRKEVLLHGTYDDYIKEYKSRSGVSSSTKNPPSMAHVAAAYQKALTQVASALQQQGSSSKMDSRTYSRRVEEFLEKMRNGQPVSSKTTKS